VADRTETVLLASPLSAICISVFLSLQQGGWYITLKSVHRNMLIFLLDIFLAVAVVRKDILFKLH